MTEETQQERDEHAMNGANLPKKQKKAPGKNGANLPKTKVPPEPKWTLTPIRSFFKQQQTHQEHPGGHAQADVILNPDNGDVRHNVDTRQARAQNGGESFSAALAPGTAGARKRPLHQTSARAEKEPMVDAAENDQLPTSTRRVDPISTSMQDIEDIGEVSDLLSDLDEISQDELRGASDRVQTVTDERIKQINDLVAAKEKEIMQV